MAFDRYRTPEVNDGVVVFPNLANGEDLTLLNFYTFSIFIEEIVRYLRNTPSSTSIGKNIDVSTVNARSSIQGPVLNLESFPNIIFMTDLNPDADDSDDESYLKGKEFRNVLRRFSEDKGVNYYELFQALAPFFAFNFDSPSFNEYIFLDPRCWAKLDNLESEYYTGLLYEGSPAIRLSSDSVLFSKMQQYEQQLSKILETLLKRRLLLKLVQSGQEGKILFFQYFLKPLTSFVDIDPNAFQYYKEGESDSFLDLITIVRQVAGEFEMDYLELMNAISPLFFTRYGEPHIYFVDLPNSKI